jgi:hypothetical protein
MKTNSIIIFTLILMLITNVSIAQNENDDTTSADNTSFFSKDNLGFFVAPGLGFTQMDGDATTLLNIRAGVSVDDKISIGGFFSTALNQINPESETIPNIYMDYNVWGGFVEYTLMSNKRFHLSLPLYIGYGEVQMDNESGDAGLGEQQFFQFEPSALLEVNLYEYVRFNLGAGYRFIENMSYRNFDQSDISGFTLYAGFKIGLFK